VSPLRAPVVTDLKGVGPRVAERLARLGICSIPDLLFHLPLRYQDRTRVVRIAALRPGEEVVVEAQVLDAQVLYRRRRSLWVEVGDGDARLGLRLFHFSAAQRHALSPGVRIRCFGVVRAGPQGLEMIHPEYRLIGEPAPVVEDHLTPIYPTTEGLHQLALRRLTGQALAWMCADDHPLADWLPREGLGVGYALEASLLYVHRPPPDADLVLLSQGRHPAQQRLAFEELLAHQLSLVQLRERIHRQGAPALETEDGLYGRFLQTLPFALTAAQGRVIGEILEDLRRSRPMLRLVQGDVGSGKTVVAAAACLRAVEAGHQTAVMAPTELLAEQHYRSFRAWMSALGVETAWLSGRQPVRERGRMLERIASGEAAVAIGTHALFQEAVRFRSLALVVVDEQHRFGVHQRLALREKGLAGGACPHQLIMTATPIPRTLAMTAYADLDYSVIDELPPGRHPIKTVAVPERRRDEVLARVARVCGEDAQQAYWVCTLVEESEALQCQAAEATARSLCEALPQLVVGLVHGRMAPREKEAAMGRFKAGEIQLLVATTVIEVGVDVPNASLMIIENAERLGLAQLHQLRGRVGRGSLQSACVLMYRPPLSESARERLRALRETCDGFEIARIDLELRGPGEVLGTRQTGGLQLLIADVMRDQALLPQVKETARRMLVQHPAHVAPLIERWLGGGLGYAQV
jgi:ATP-dependent DNA helicase RecG